jgi:hypothetical protein
MSSVRRRERTTHEQGHPLRHDHMVAKLAEHTERRGGGPQRGNDTAPTRCRASFTARSDWLPGGEKVQDLRAHALHREYISRRLARPPAA